MRRVAPDGIITRVAGTPGNAGSAGDDGPATEATLSDPVGVAVTADGGFLIADPGNRTVRKVSATGIITRVAGTTGVAGSVAGFLSLGAAPGTAAGALLGLALDVVVLGLVFAAFALVMAAREIVHLARGRAAATTTTAEGDPAS